MKLSTGIIRRVDELGRIVIPKEMRRELNIDQKDPIEISIEGQSIVLRKYQNKCVFCGALKPTIRYNGKLICTHCLKEINKSLEA
jgi:transcriptional pleiotropic regulator of transition state genes